MRSLIAGVLSCALLAGTAAAQRSSAVLRGVVVDSAATPVPNVELTLLPLGVRTRSGADGRFSIAVASGGAYRLVTRRIGFVADTLPVVLRDGEVTETQVQLGRVGLLVAREIRAMQLALPRMIDRVERGISTVMLPEEIKAYRLYNVEDMLRYVPRFQRRSVVMVDGRPVRDPMDYPHPNDIAAVELARGMYGWDDPDLWLPMWYRRDSFRDVIMIWTKPFVADAPFRRFEEAKALEAKLERQAERDASRARRDSLRAERNARRP